MSTADRIFNSGVACFAVAHADRLGILDELGRSGVYRFDPQAEPVVLQIAYVLVAEGVVTGDPDAGVLRAGPDMAEWLSLKGFFTWLFSASGEVLARGAGVRNGDLVAAATADFGRRLIDPVLLASPELQKAAGIVDLGCGDASRLLRICDALGCRGLGIDISAAALDRAERNIHAAEAGHLVSTRLGDVRDLPSLPPGYSCALMCLMGHDLWPAAKCVEVLAGIRHASDCDSMILVETVQAERRHGHRVDSGVPSVGYEYLHALMNQRIPAEAEWDAVIGEAGWAIARKERLDLPANTIIYFCKA
jgi:hypothetical protein